MLVGGVFAVLAKWKGLLAIISGQPGSSIGPIEGGRALKLRQNYCVIEENRGVGIESLTSLWGQIQTGACQIMLRLQR
jgi:hypothetical protein